MRTGTAWWIEVDGHVLLERRPAKGLLGGMLGLPGSAWTAVGDGCHPPESAGDPSLRLTPLPAPVRHVFTHFELRLTVAVATPATRPDLPGEWHPVAAIAAAGLPTLFARAADAVLRARAEAAQSPRLALETAA